MLQRQYIFYSRDNRSDFDNYIGGNCRTLDSKDEESSVSFNNNIRGNGHVVTEEEVGGVKHVLASR